MNSCDTEMLSYFTPLNVGAGGVGAGDGVVGVLLWPPHPAAMRVRTIAQARLGIRGVSPRRGREINEDGFCSLVFRAQRPVSSRR